MRLRVLTRNVQHDHGDPRRTPLLNRELRRRDPDVVAFQEVRYPDQLRELVAGTGLRHATHQAELLAPLPAELARSGCTAVATRWPHRVAEVVEHRTPAGPHWWVLAVAVRPPGPDEQVVIVPTTPWPPDAEPARERVAAAVLELADRHRTRRPAIVSGDLNAGPDSPGVRLLTGAGYRDAWAVAGAGPGHTWSVDNPLAAAEIARVVGRLDHRARIDHVLVGPDAEVRVRVVAATLVGDRPVDGVWLSDHAGVLVDLELS